MLRIAVSAESGDLLVASARDILKSMIQTQIQFPDSLFRRLEEIAEQQDWSLSDVIQKAAESFIERFPSPVDTRNTWQFPTLDCGGDFLVDPAKTSVETDAIVNRGAS
ncbi:MAG TPA: hypothetical protein PLV92_14385 [Pirellulaceae bacterium]|nr:hypothetical protein [Pirellulaceae bacterium]